MLSDYGKTHLLLAPYVLLSLCLGEGVARGPDPAIMSLPYYSQGLLRRRVLATVPRPRDRCLETVMRFSLKLAASPSISHPEQPLVFVSVWPFVCCDDSYMEKSSHLMLISYASWRKR